jgi:hypothetical protein
MKRTILPALTLILVTATSGSADTVRGALTSLCDPAKIATVASERGVNQQVLEIVYWLERARLDGRDPATEMREVMAAIGWGGKTQGEFTAMAMVRNRLIAERLGCLDEAGMADLRLGNAPIIHSGPYAGDELSVAYIIPPSVCSELDTTLANFELMPLRMNRRKYNSVSERECDLALKFYDAGLLSQEALRSFYEAFEAALISIDRMDKGFCGTGRIQRHSLLQKQRVEFNKRGLLKDLSFRGKTK